MNLLDFIKKLVYFFIICLIKFFNPNFIKI